MEIEIRAFIKDIKETKKKIIELGALDETNKHIVDYWFCKKDATKFEDVQQHKPGSYGLRIRKQKEDDNEIYELNCKTLESLGDHNAFNEYETKIEDFEQTKKLLECIGFKVFCVVDKKRTHYSYKNCTINVEDIKEFRPAIELEIISNENIEENKSILTEILKELGIKDEDIIEKSITRLYMKEFSFK